MTRASVFRFRGLPAGNNASLRRTLARACGAAMLATTLGGCSLLGGKGDPPTFYSPSPQVRAEASWPKVGWQLALVTTAASPAVDSPRIAVRPTPNEMQVYKGASWSRRPSDMLEDVLVRALEDSGKVPAVARPGSGVTTDYRLVLDLRRFEADYRGGATPYAVLEVNAKLLHAQDTDVVATRTFLIDEAASGTAVPTVVDAFDRVLARGGHDIAGWVLAEGATHRDR